MLNVRLTGGHLYGKQLFTWLSLVVSLMASFVVSFFPQDVLDEIWDLVGSISGGFLTYSCSIGRLPCLSGVLSLFSIIFSEIIGPFEARFLGILHRSGQSG